MIDTPKRSFIGEVERSAKEDKKVEHLKFATKGAECMIGSSGHMPDLQIPALGKTLMIAASTPTPENTRRREFVDLSYILGNKPKSRYEVILIMYNI